MFILGLFSQSFSTQAAQCRLFSFTPLIASLCFPSVLGFRIRRAGYPIRHAFQEFVNRYYMLAKGMKVSDSGNVIEKCKKILLGTLGEGLWQIGKTKVFLKVSHS